MNLLNLTNLKALQYNMPYFLFIYLISPTVE